MSQEYSIQILLDKIYDLTEKRKSHWERLTAEINGLGAAVELLSGKKVWEAALDISFDDINPDYIKGTEDGI